MNPDIAASGPRPVCSTHGASRPRARSEANAVSSQSRLDCSSSPVNAATPPRPSRRSAFVPRPRPAPDHSSVPSTPKARSALGKKRSSTPGHSGPSSRPFPSASRSRNAEAPSGNALAVGRSVLRYSSPREASSPASSACAAPPTHSGCHALKTSWKKPGSVSSAVWIAPPSQSLRSSTHTRQPPRASSAPHASELTPLPTMTASYSATGGELPEFLVADEAALPRTERLHARQKIRAALFRNVEPELLRLDADRVQPALLPQHDAALRRDELRRVRLDRRWIVELRCDRAGLAAKKRLARHRLPRLELVAGELLHARRHVAHALELQVRLDTVERAQRERELAEVRVAGALSHAVDRPLDPRRTRAHRCHGGRRREPEVVVPVKMHGHIRADPFERLADELRDCLRRRDAERVDDDDLVRARLDRGHIHALVEVELGACRVDAEERRVDAVLRREAHRGRDPAEHLLAVDSDRVQLQIGDRRLDHGRVHAELDERFEVRRHRAREAPDLRAQPGAGNQLHRVPVVLRDAREPGLDPVDAELVEELRDLELLLGIEHDADGLLAVTQRRVVEANVPADAERVVQGPGPDLTQQRTTPSGNADSFSSPSAATRKLSSTRRPPPPSQ